MPSTTGSTPRGRCAVQRPMPDRLRWWLFLGVAHPTPRMRYYTNRELLLMTARKVIELYASIGRKIAAGFAPIANVFDTVTEPLGRDDERPGGAS